MVGVSRLKDFTTILNLDLVLTTRSIGLLRELNGRVVKHFVDT